MALTNIELVRNGIGDVVLPYKLTDAQITDYLTLYSDNVNDTIVALKPIILAILAATAGKDVIGDFERDEIDAPKNYLNAIKYLDEETKNLTPAASRGYPIVGGTTLSEDVAIDIFYDEDY